MKRRKTGIQIGHYVQVILPGDEVIKARVVSLDRSGRFFRARLVDSFTGHKMNVEIALHGSLWVKGWSKAGADVLLAHRAAKALVA